MQFRQTQRRRDASECAGSNFVCKGRHAGRSPQFQLEIIMEIQPRGIYFRSFTVANPSERYPLRVARRRRSLTRAQSVTSKRRERKLYPGEKKTAIDCRYSMPIKLNLEGARRATRRGEMRFLLYTKKCCPVHFYDRSTKWRIDSF